MSFSTSSWKHPTVVEAAPAAPRTLRKSRRLTPADPEGWVMREVLGGRTQASGCRQPTSVVTGAAVVPCFLGREGKVLGRRRAAGGANGIGGLVAVDVTVHAPAHVERRRLIDLGHVLH